MLNFIGHACPPCASALAHLLLVVNTFKCQYGTANNSLRKVASTVPSVDTPFSKMHINMNAVGDRKSVV